MKISTKQKIINTSIQMFNKNGYGSVSLFEIAKELGISRGNLTYHFKTKDELLKAISEEMWSKIMEERYNSRQLPSFKNLHQEIQLYYKFQKEYSFIFLDYHVLRHSIINDKFKDMTQQSITDNEAAIAFAINSGNMNKEPFPGIYKNIAFNTWMLTFFWLNQQIIRGERTQEDGERMIWSMLLPHFTEKGVKAFTSFFGEEYITSLGEPFHLKVDQFVSF